MKEIERNKGSRMESDVAIRVSCAAFDDELVSAKEITTALHIGNTKWWNGVRSGIYPAPVRLGARCTRWRKSAIHELMMHGV